jgi:CBS domain-containing protein
MQTSVRRETARIAGGLMRVEEMMSKNLFCCTPTDGIQQAAKLMKDNDVGAIPVVNDCNERKLLGRNCWASLRIGISASMPSPWGNPLER